MYFLRVFFAARLDIHVYSEGLCLLDLIYMYILRFFLLLDDIHVYSEGIFAARLDIHVFSEGFSLLMYRYKCMYCNTKIKLMIKNFTFYKYNISHTTVVSF